MYPRITDLLHDLFGLNFTFPANSYGFFVALAFLGAYQMLRWDMRNRESQGQFALKRVKVRVSGPVAITEVAIQAVIWGLVGYKLGYGLLHWHDFSTQPQEVLLSGEGSIIFGLVGAAIAGGLRYNLYRKKKDEKEVFEEQSVPPSTWLGTVLTIAFVAGLLGAKVFHHLEYLDDFLRDPVGQFVSFNGLTFLGGLITAAFFIIRFWIKKGYNILHMVDVFAPCLILAYGIGRIGCMVAGDGDWGIANPDPQPDWLAWLPEWTWAFDFPNNVNGEGVPIRPEDGLPCIEGFCTHLVPKVFPTPFYETSMAFTIFGILVILRNRFKFAGQMTGTYMFLIGIERFLIEKIRVNSTYKIAGWEITQAEILSSLLILGGMAIFAYATFKLKRYPTPDGKPKSEAQTT
ncbi:MAG: prolipoprotein diacylglyceryl transferase [Bacteroidia bacterium]|nr:prolipoprotein diacylglyceryl transferase [Bacteroidia bacterium]